MNPARELLHLNVADYIIIGVITLSTLLSLLRGIFKEVISLGVWIVGFWVALKFYVTLAAVLESYISSLTIRLAVSFALLFLVVLILGAMFNFLLSLLIEKSGLSGPDRLLGMMFGCARGILLVAVALLLIATTAFVQDVWWQKSVLIPHFQILLDWLRAFLPKEFPAITKLVSDFVAAN